MEYRSTGTHYSNDVVAGVGSSHGVKLGGGSTGGTVAAVGDDTDITLNILGKGAGGVRVGSTATGSLGFKGAFTSTWTYALAAVSSGQVGEITIASTTADINPGDLIGVNVTPTTSVLVFAGYRMSTVAASRMTIVMANVSSTATSTTSGEVRITWLDLT
jgi:hypothetical protein